MAEKQFMRRALTLAKKGGGFVNPNPLVGAVLVKDDRIIGEGYHHKYGGLHAEREAIKDCIKRGNSPEGSVLYVTLEPCCHYGKQPPCTEAIIQNNIGKVIIGSLDPNPLVSGKGILFLKEHGVEVETGFLKEECDLLNGIFFHYIKTNRPFIAIKTASTLDGKTATALGESKWITGEKSRLYVQKIRSRYACILTGINTVLKDDPLLTCRLKNSHSPVRLILDSSLKIPLESNIVLTAASVRTIVFYCKQDAETEGKAQALKGLGVETVLSPKEEYTDSVSCRVSLDFVIDYLAKEKLDSVLVEAGGEVNASFVEKHLVNYLYWFTAPRIFGGQGHCAIGGNGISKINEALCLNCTGIKKTGEDMLLEYEVKGENNVYGNN